MYIPCLVNSTMTARARPQLISFGFGVIVVAKSRDIYNNLVPAKANCGHNKMIAGGESER